MDPIKTQLVVDCAEPLPLAQFWAAALHWTVEDNHEFVKQLVDAGVVAEGDYQSDKQGRMFFSTLVAAHHPDGKAAGRILFQKVPEPKTVKNRLHLDLNVGRERIPEEIERLAELGATHTGTFDRPEGYWAAMLDPEGNEFDLQ